MESRDTDPKLFTAGQLHSFAVQVYRSLGVRAPDAKTIAESLVRADLWGHQSHGIMRTFWYVERIQSGAVDVTAAPRILLDSGAVAVVDGSNGPGQVVAQHAMTLAIDRAKQHGIGAVAVRHSGHFGTAMFFTRQAASADCIGFLSTNASPAMAPWGGRDKLIGTNPWSIAAPAGKYAPMVLDVANTAVARGKLYVAQQRGEKIPAAWAITRDGSPTTDPAEGILGNILPMAAHKGYAIATMMDVLSGILSASSFADGVVGPYQSDGVSGAGHLAIALNIAAFRPLSEFNADMETLIHKIKSSRRIPTADEIYYPGELEHNQQLQQQRSGIRLPLSTVQALDEASRQLGLVTLTEYGQA